MDGTPNLPPAPSGLASEGAIVGHGVGLVLLILGFIGTMTGGVLSSLCLVAGGIVCAGTSIGSIGFAMLGLGAVGLVIGGALVLRTRGAYREALRARAKLRWAATRKASVGALQADLPLARANVDAAPTASAGPVASDCPKCGGPVKPGASVCEWCGEPFR